MTRDVRRYYETVKGINWISGHAIKRILSHGPSFKFYMGLKDKPGIIYDIAYSDMEVINIGSAVVKGMKLKEFSDVSVGHVSDKTAASLYYICQKHYQDPDDGKIYKIEIPLSVGQELFEDWCFRVKGKVPTSPEEKVRFYQEWRSAGN